MKPFWKEMKNLMICVCVHRIFSKENAYVDSIQWHTFYDDRTTEAEERERESKKN